MTTAKVFQSGNSQAVRLPREMRLEVSEVEIIRHGDVLILRPLRPQATLASAFDALTGIGDDFLPGGREQGEPQERETFLTPPLRYLLDTNICIFIIKNRPAAVRARFDGLRPGEVGLSAVTEAELLHGADKSERVDHNLAAVLDFASQLVVLPFDSHVTEAYGRVRAGLEQIGQPIGPLDVQIAATALAHGLILVTNNTREFARVPGLRLEDWTQ